MRGLSSLRSSLAWFIFFYPAYYAEYRLYHQHSRFLVASRQPALLIKRPTTLSDNRSFDRSPPPSLISLMRKISHSEMLPKFQLRDMRRSSSSPPPASHSGPRFSSREPLVKLTAPEYDNTITGHPEATLKYVDEDDGEIVTVSVGSCILAARVNFLNRLALHWSFLNALKIPFHETVILLNITTFSTSIAKKTWLRFGNPLPSAPAV